MTHLDPDSAGPSRATETAMALAPSPDIASSADDGWDAESWVGYESLHPLTWVPAHAAPRTP